jgi:hypothetical protein
VSFCYPFAICCQPLRSRDLGIAHISERELPGRLSASNSLVEVGPAELVREQYPVEFVDFFLDQFLPRDRDLPVIVRFSRVNLEIDISTETSDPLRALLAFPTGLAAANALHERQPWSGSETLRRREPGDPSHLFGTLTCIPFHVCQRRPGIKPIGIFRFSSYQ